MHEYAEITHFKHTIKGTELLVTIPKKSIGDYLKKFGNGGVVKAELRLDDGRTISAEQRKKAYATIGDIALYTGYAPEELKEIMKYYFMAESGEDYFSLSNCSMTTAREFINYLIEFCLKWNIPLKESGLERTDDIDRFIYVSMLYKKCCICGRDADLHHALEDRIGMGNNRNKVIHVGRKAISLCRIHHQELHNMIEKEFYDKYKVYPIKLDATLVEKLNL